MMEIRDVSGEDEVQAFGVLAGGALVFQLEPPVRWPDPSETPYLRVARDGALLGGYIAQPMGQFFGGKSVPMSAVRGVAVGPEHRGRGVAAALMHDALVRARDAGQPVSTLFPAVNAPYRKAGWEAAGSRWGVRIAMGELASERGPANAREADPETMRALYTRAAQAAAGRLDRSDWAWQRILAPLVPDHRRAFVLEPEGTAEAYVVCVGERDGGHRDADLRVVDAAAVTARGASALRTFLAGHSSIAGRIVVSTGPGDPLWSVLPSQRVEVAHSWGWMLRLVDVADALEVRGYAPSVRGEVHLEVRDSLLDWNDGRFVLEVEGGEGRVRPGGKGEIQCDVRGLAAAYTGYAAPAELVVTGTMEGEPTALATLGGLLAGPAPWMPEMF